jgi:class 3 adenylate cyclase
LDAKKKALLHHQYANYLEDRHKDRLSEVIFDLALHFTRGLDHSKALKYALEAGNLAQSSYANAEAASFYETVLRLLSEGFRVEGVDSASLQFRVTEQLADVLVLLGKYEDATRLYGQVLPVMTDGVESSRLHTKLGSVYFKQGNRSKTVEHFSLGLSALGIRQPTTIAGAVLSILQEAFIQIFHTYVPRYFLRRRLGKERPQDVAAMNLFQLLVSYYYFINMKFCFQIHLKQINLSERIGRPEFKKNAYGLHELLCNAVGMHRRAHKYAMRAMELDEQVRRNRSIPGTPSGMIGEGALSGIGDSALLALGRAYYYMANYDQANVYLAKAADESMKLGNLWDAEVAIGHRCMADFGKGEFESMLDHATRLQDIADGVNDVRGMGWGQVLLALVHSHLGNIDDALRHGTMAVKHNESAGDQLITAMSLRVLGQVYLRAGNFSQAIETLRKSRQVIEHHQLIHDFLPGTYIVLSESYIRAAHSDPGSRRSNLKSAKWMLLVSELLAHFFKNWSAQAKRIRALYETEMGRYDRALRALEKGIAISSQLGSRFDLAQCYAAIGSLLCDTGDSGGMEYIDKARKLFSDMKTRLDLRELERTANCTSKSDPLPQELEALDKQTAATTLRLTSLLQVCQGISAILDVDTLLKQILESAVSIVGAERGVLLLYEEDQLRIRMVHGLEPSGSLMNEHVSTSVIKRVERERQPLLTIDAQADPRFKLEESVHRYNMRSILCTPLTRGEKLLGVLYLDNRLIANLFTEQELELMVAFGAQAAIAIDNASAYRQLEDLTDSLEQRVRQRTEELRAQEREIARLQKEKIARFLPRNLADMITSGEHEEFLKGHRRELTVVFVDLRGFTSFVEKTDPEEVMSILREYHAAMGHLVSEYGGTLERFIGDAVMVYFNDPLPCPNHAEQAVKMAIAMRQAIYSLQQQWKKRGIELGAGIGIATGYATIGAVGFEDRLDYAAIGPVTNLAARLCSEAQHGQILISDRVVGLVKDLIAEPIGEVSLKGIQRPVAVSQVIGMRP